MTLTSCEKNNELDEFKQGVEITVKKDKGAPLADGDIWFHNSTTSPGKNLEFKAGNREESFRDIDIPNGTEPIVLRLPASGHNNRYIMYVRNDRTNRQKGWDIEVPKGKVQKVVIRVYKKGTIDVFFNDKVLIKDL